MEPFCNLGAAFKSHLNATLGIPLTFHNQFHSTAKQNGFYNVAFRLCETKCYGYLLLPTFIVLFILVRTENISLFQTWAP